MSTLDDQVEVLRVACLTEDRAPAEQRAMLAQALALDSERGAFVSANFRGDRSPVPPTLVELVRQTYQTEGRRVDLTKQQQGLYKRLDEKWYVCSSCGAPRGMHPADGCATNMTPYQQDLLNRVVAAAMEG